MINLIIIKWSALLQLQMEIMCEVSQIQCDYYLPIYKTLFFGKYTNTTPIFCMYMLPSAIMRWIGIPRPDLWCWVFDCTERFGTIYVKHGNTRCLVQPQMHRGTHIKVFNNLNWKSQYYAYGTRNCRKLRKIHYGQGHTIFPNDFFIRIQIS